MRRPLSGRHRGLLRGVRTGRAPRAPLLDGPGERKQFWIDKKARRPHPPPSTTTAPTSPRSRKGRGVTTRPPRSPSWSRPRSASARRRRTRARPRRPQRPASSCRHKPRTRGRPSTRPCSAASASRRATRGEAPRGHLGRRVLSRRARRHDPARCDHTSRAQLARTARSAHRRGGVGLVGLDRRAHRRCGAARAPHRRFERTSRARGLRETDGSSFTRRSPSIADARRPSLPLWSSHASAAISEVVMLVGAGGLVAGGAFLGVTFAEQGAASEHFTISGRPATSRHPARAVQHRSHGARPVADGVGGSGGWRLRVLAAGGALFLFDHPTGDNRTSRARADPHAWARPAGCGCTVRGFSSSGRLPRIQRCRGRRALLTRVCSRPHARCCRRLSRLQRRRRNGSNPP